MRAFSILFFFILSGFSVLGNSQNSNALLLNGSSARLPQEAGLESGRYQTVDNPPHEDQFSESRTPVKKNKYKKQPASESTDEAKATPAPARSDLKTPILPTEEKPPASEKEFDVSDQLKDLVQGNGSASAQIYKEQIHPDDIRMNVIEVMFASSLMYNGSISNFSYRNYSSFSPYLDVGAEFWMTPLFGISGKYGTSFSADVSANNSSREKVSVRHESLDLALDFRKFFGMSRKSNSVNFGFHYMDYKLQVPLDDLTRMRLKTSGFGVHIMARIPTAASYAWTFGGFIDPRLSHTELSTGINAESGSSPESSRVGLNIGGEFKMSRQHQITWQLSVAVQKDRFSSNSLVADPETGSAINGVSVTNSFSFLSLGYRWGQ